MFSVTLGVLKRKLLAFPGVLEGLGSSRGLVGTISTYPGTYKCPGAQVMAKNPRGDCFYRLRYIQQTKTI